MNTERRPRLHDLLPPVAREEGLPLMDQTLPEEARRNRHVGWITRPARCSATRRWCAPPSRSMPCWMPRKTWLNRSGLPVWGNWPIHGAKVLRSEQHAAPEPRPGLRRRADRAFGLGWRDPYSVRYANNLDDGPWRQRLGGFGAGCIGRGSRGDFNLWHRRWRALGGTIPDCRSPCGNDGGPCPATARIV